MTTSNFNTLKSNLTTVLLDFEFSQELINSLLTDDFINGLLDLRQLQPENNEFINFIENFSDQQNLNSIRQFDSLLRDELAKDGYVRDVLTYIRNSWANITFPDEVMTRSLAAGLQRIAAIVSAALSTIANSAAGKIFFLYQDVIGWWDMAKWTHDKQNEYYDIMEKTIQKEEAALRGNIQSNMSTATTARSPLVVDLDGDGVETTTVESGVYFDHDDNGFAEKSGWVGKDDGLLVRDINNNGLIDDGTELFGNNSVLSSGQKAANGFEALADLDSNSDGVFNSSDTAWNQVKVWKDGNQNGEVDSGELLTLEQAGVSGINLNYENETTTDENGNQHKQTGTFIKTDGTTGSVHDVWFDADYANTMDTTDVEISDTIAALPNIQGLGNVHDLHTAMALDTTGELKTLIEQYIAENNVATRQGMLDNIIFHWTGVQDVDPLSRKPSYFYDNPIGDARYLEALERFLGEKYANKWWFGREEQNPHEQAAEILLQGFDIIKNYVMASLESQTHCADLLEEITLTWNATTQSWSVDVSGAVTALNTMAATNMDNAVSTLHILENIIKQQDIMVEEINAAFQAYGSTVGSLQLFYDKFGTMDNQISNGNDIIYGNDDANNINGLAGNDKIYGENGDDILIGGIGNDYLVGGNGSDTYFFEGSWGHDKIDNSSNDEVGSVVDTIEFGAGILPTDITIKRQGNDLILSTANDANSVTVYSYFLDAGNTNNTVSQIKFADGTIWDYDYVRVAWNAAPVSVGGFVTKEGTTGNDIISGTSGNDFLSGNDGNDSILAGAGNDVIYGGKGDDRRLEGGGGDDTYYWNLGDGMDTITDSGNNDAICFGEGISFNDLIFRNEGSHLRILVNGDETQGMLIKSFFNTNNSYKIEELYFADGSNVHLSEIGLTLHQVETSNRYVNGTAFDDIIYGSDANEYIMALAGDDIINGGKGDDTIEGNEGNNIYVYNPGDDLDKIIDSTGTAVVRFGEGIEFEDLTFRYQHDSRYLRVSVNGDDTQGLLLYWQMHTSYDYYGAKYFEFADGTSIDMRNMGYTLQQTDAAETVYGTDFNDVIYGNGGDDSLNGGEGSDSYVWNWGDGLDTIGEQNVAGTDKIVFGEGISFSDLTFSFPSSFQITVKGDATQGIKIANQYFTGVNEYSGAGIEQLVFADGSTVNLKEIGLTIHQENHPYAPTQQVYTNGTNYNDVIYGRDGRDTIRAYGGNDLVYGNGGVDNIYGGDGDDTLYGESGDDNIYGNDGNDSMYGGLGDDYLEGGNGSDTYYWNWGDGFDIIDDEGEESDIDKIVFGAGITFEDLTFRQYYNKHFQIIVKGDETQGIELIYQDFTGNTGSYEHRGIEQLVFADGSVVNLKEIGLVIHNEDDEFSANSTNYVYGTDYNDVIHGSAGRENISTYDGDDVIYGNDGNDNIYSGDRDDCLYGGNGNDYLSAGEGNDVLDGGAGDDDLLGGKGNDILAGGAGNDVLNGDYGDDIYVYNLGDGLDTIDDRRGSETIKFGENITQSNLTYSQDSNNLVININNNSEQGIIIEDYFYSAAYKNKTIEFADGSTFDLSNADQLIQAMSSFAANSASTMDEICNPVANVSEMCPLSANPDLLKQAI